jgi:hypothetical protein
MALATGAFHTRMTIERAPNGLEARLWMAGIGRFFNAVFLSLWLVGWAVGEAFVIWVLIWGARSMFFGGAPDAFREAEAMATVLLLGLFLLMWLTLWTLAGAVTVGGLLRLLFGRDRIVASPEGLVIEHHYGLFRSRRSVPRDEVKRVYRLADDGVLCVETTRGSIEVTQLGAAADRVELERALHAEFHVSSDPRPDGALPNGWIEIVFSEHAALIEDPVIRRKQAKVAWALCGSCLILAVYLISVARELTALWLVGLIVGAIACLAGWGAIRLSFGRSEWKLEHGRVILRTGFSQLKVRFESVRLELAEEQFHRRRPTYQLTAIAAADVYGKHPRVLFSEFKDPTASRNLGFWLSRRCRIPFTDKTANQVGARAI